MPACLAAEGVHLHVDGAYLDAAMPTARRRFRRVTPECSPMPSLFFFRRARVRISSAAAANGQMGRLAARQAHAAASASEPMMRDAGARFIFRRGRRADGLRCRQRAAISRLDVIARASSASPAI